MSELKKSISFSKGIILPVKLKVEAKKLDGGLWELKYAEWFDLEDKALLKEAISSTKTILEKLGFKITTRGNKLSFYVKGSIDMVATGVIWELLSLSKAGDMNIRDLMVLAGLGAFALGARAPPPPPPPAKVQKVVDEV